MMAGEFEAFLSEVTARLGLRAAGYRRTGRSVRRRLSRRLSELGLSSLAEYRRHLEAHLAEWVWLDACCRITISRFARDRAVFDVLVGEHLPALAAKCAADGRSHLRLWSAGCASGEEPYGLALAWCIDLETRFPTLALDVLATDADPVLLARAERATYPEGTLRELPERLRGAFEPSGAEWVLPRRFRGNVRLERADLRREQPDGAFDVICCRNLAFTYFDGPTQRRLALAFGERLRPGGVLVVGEGERVPNGSGGFAPLSPCIHIRTDCR